MTRVIAALGVALLLLAGCSDDSELRGADESPPSTTPASTPSSNLEKPRFQDARIVVRPGADRAFVGYTIIGTGDNQYASLSDIRAVGPDGRQIEWKHQTATGGPSEIVATAGRIVRSPPTGPGGDEDYFDASEVVVGQTVMVTFTFPSGEVEVPFKVIQVS